jgi:hypothetical protein
LILGDAEEVGEFNAGIRGGWIKIHKRIMAGYGEERKE